MMDGRIVESLASEGVKRHEEKMEKVYLDETRVAFSRPSAARRLTVQCRAEAATRQSPQKEETRHLAQMTNGQAPMTNGGILDLRFAYYMTADP